MKKLLILFTVLFLSLTCRPVSADMGPKPSVNITFENAPDHPYYVTLLGTDEFIGPWSAISPEQIDSQADDIRPAYVAFYEYAQATGLYFCDFVRECSDDNEFKWGYYPPSSFCIAVYDSVDGTLRVSDVIEREAFDSYYTIDLSASELTVVEDYHITRYVISFLIRMVATILIELLLAWLFGYRMKKEARMIIFTNILTQFLLNGIMLLLDYYSGLMVWLFVYPAMELAVFIIELAVYLINFKRHKKLKTFFYTLIANGITFLLGLYIAVVASAF
ncbi:MAG: hypothetical protein IJL85_00260 [Erysipelotrichaceae bacterium]|nr:hypothetical protein [Erysipelotrichaceae bacterium]